jgi:hypothetical protein
MKTLELKSENRRSVLIKLNLSIGIFLFMISSLTIYIYILKNHYFFEKNNLMELVAASFLVPLISIHYVLFVQISRIIKVNLFTLIFRHLLNLTFIAWIVLAITSKGNIEIGEISGVIYIYLLFELYQTIHKITQLETQNHKQLNLEIKKTIFSIIVLMTVILQKFYFSFDYRLSFFNFLIHLSIYVIYASLIVINVNLILSFLFRKSLTDEVTE